MIDPAQNYRFGLPVAASTYADRVDFSLHVLHVGMLAIFVLWAIFFVYCLVRFRRSRNPVASYNGGKGNMLSFLPDAAVLIFELWLVFFFGLPIWTHIKEDFPPADKAFTVNMIAEQFAWGFQYAGPDSQFGRRDPKLMSGTNPVGLDESEEAAKDDVVSLNNLVVPLGRPTILNMTSKDVIHSFFVPEFRTKQDVVPGMQTRLWFEPKQEGVYEIGCAQLCGLGHYRMKGEVTVLAPEKFDAWMEERRKEKEAAASGEAL